MGFFGAFTGASSSTVNRSGVTNACSCASWFGRHHDVLRLALKSGEVRVVYFDLTAMLKALKLFDFASQNDDEE